LSLIPHQRRSIGSASSLLLKLLTYEYLSSEPWRMINSPWCPRAAVDSLQSWSGYQCHLWPSFRYNKSAKSSVTPRIAIFYATSAVFSLIGMHTL